MYVLSLSPCNLVYKQAWRKCWLIENALYTNSKRWEIAADYQMYWYMTESQYGFTPGYLTCSVYFKLKEELNVQEVHFENW